MTTATAPAVTVTSAATELRLAGPTEAELAEFYLDHDYGTTLADFDPTDPYWRQQWWASLRARAAHSDWPN